MDLCKPLPLTTKQMEEMFHRAARSLNLTRTQVGVALAAHRPQALHSRHGTEVIAICRRESFLRHLPEVG